jgi:hypothetical protein
MVAKAKGSPRMRPRFTLAIVTAMAAAMAGCSSCDCENIDATGSGYAEFPSPLASPAAANCAAGLTAAKRQEACNQALQQANASAAGKCKGVPLLRSNPAEVTACLARAEAYPKGPRLCGVSTTTDRKYYCCSGVEVVSRAPSSSSNDH